MAIEKTDFYSIFLEEGEPFYDDIYSLKQDEFNEWVSNNFKETQTVNSFEEVAPSKDYIKYFLKKGYKHIFPPQCHYSAKAVNIINPEYEYWTGFIHSQDFVLPIVTHSFNIFEGKIIDFARIDDKFKLLSKKDPYFPHTYYGIMIPAEFVKQFEEETFKNFSMKPLLFEWYKENNGA